MAAVMRLQEQAVGAVMRLQEQRRGATALDVAVAIDLEASGRPDEAHATGILDTLVAQGRLLRSVWSFPESTPVTFVVIYHLPPAPQTVPVEVPVTVTVSA